MPVVSLHLLEVLCKSLHFYIHVKVTFWGINYLCRHLASKGIVLLGITLCVCVSALVSVAKVMRCILCSLVKNCDRSDDLGVIVCCLVFIALMLLIRLQERHPVCKKSCSNNPQSFTFWDAS